MHSNPSQSFILNIFIRKPVFSHSLGFYSDEIRMDQSPAVVKKPGESVKISCKINGFDMTDYFIHWIRQKPGKALEWIGRMNAGSNDATYAESLKNQFVLTEDVSASTQYLEAKSLRTEDTAVYYCARQATVTATEEAAVQKPHTHFSHSILLNKSLLFIRTQDE
ncbi:hypothetical protein HF521_004921 [Silurus meridionalis]|uniref:Ig-like domain-containing protein n=1 Tax=Silurus meridionalis TaxID=175797 RepID=A0A8T0B3A1_SILME|nr:hypothetical protein HF521_004921 [Silurus meridionalis]